MRATRVIGSAYGAGVRSRNFVGNFMVGIRTIFSKKQSGYLKMSSQTCDDALEKWRNMPFLWD
jgi:uncharacterized protein YbjQ (UPF0145 family)